MTVPSASRSRFQLDAPRLLWWPKQTMLSTHHPCFVLIFTLLKVTYTISFVSPDISQKASSLYSIVSLAISVSLQHLNRGIVEGYCLGFTGSQVESTFSCKERQDGHSGTSPVLRRVETTDHESAWATKWDIVLKKTNKQIKQQSWHLSPRLANIKLAAKSNIYNGLKTKIIIQGLIYIYI